MGGALPGMIEVMGPVSTVGKGHRGDIGTTRLVIIAGTPMVTHCQVATINKQLAPMEHHSSHRLLFHKGLAQRPSEHLVLRP